MRPSESTLRALLLALTLPLSACSLLVDGALGGEPMMMGSACDGLDDGTPCERAGISAPLVCRGGVCTNSRCGDGLVDSRSELCDDNNLTDGDGCESDCTETVGCSSPFDCPFPGIECLEATCSDMECGIGVTADDTPCNTDLGAGVCRSGSCVSALCGNGALDAEEGCDDGNPFYGDGCSPECTPECTDSSQCSQDPCFGVQECQTSLAMNGGVLGVCALLTAPVDCGPPACAFCDSLTGSCLPAPDADHHGDGYAGPCCGLDSHRGNPDAHPGPLEECDPEGLDSNCAPGDEPSATDWYADCDADGYASLDATAASACQQPPVSDTCVSWTSRVPTATSNDCHDGDYEVRPGAPSFHDSPYRRTDGGTSFDYNCNGSFDPQYGDALTPDLVGCGGTGTGCDVRPPSPLFPQRISCGSSATLYSCVDVRIACRRTASDAPVVKRCR